MVSFEHAFTRCVGSALARQFALADVLENRNWGLDIRRGLVSFDELQYPIQLLGTESTSEETWMWAWANEASALPESVVSASRTLQRLGARTGPELLTEPVFALEGISGHQVAMLCTGLLKTGPYYRGPYDGGAVYFVVEGIELPPVEGPRIGTVLTTVIESFDVDHRGMTREFLSALGLSLTEDNETIIGSGAKGSVRVDFDGLGRLRNAQVSLGGHG